MANRYHSVKGLVSAGVWVRDILVNPNDWSVFTRLDNDWEILKHFPVHFSNAIPGGTGP